MKAPPEPPPAVCSSSGPQRQHSQQLDYYGVTYRARVAEWADAPDLGSGGETRGGSSPPFRTSNLNGTYRSALFGCAQLCATPNVLGSPAVPPDCRTQ